MYVLHCDWKAKLLSIQTFLEELWQWHTVTVFRWCMGQLFGAHFDRSTFTQLWWPWSFGWRLPASRSRFSLILVKSSSWAKFPLTSPDPKVLAEVELHLFQVHHQILGPFWREELLRVGQCKCLRSTKGNWRDLKLNAFWQCIIVWKASVCIGICWQEPATLPPATLYVNIWDFLWCLQESGMLWALPKLTKLICPKFWHRFMNLHAELPNIKNNFHPNVPQQIWMPDALPSRLRPVLPQWHEILTLCQAAACGRHAESWLYWRVQLHCLVGKELWIFADVLTALQGWYKEGFRGFPIQNNFNVSMTLYICLYALVIFQTLGKPLAEPRIFFGPYPMSNIFWELGSLTLEISRVKRKNHCLAVIKMIWWKGEESERFPYGF